MIEDRQKAWDSYEGFLKDLDGLRSYLDDPKGYCKPNMMIVTDPREDGRDYIMFEDYITEGEDGDFRCDDVHHDGTNHYLYRAFRDGVSEDQMHDLEDKIYLGTASHEDIERITRRLGDEIGKVYGWIFPPEQKAEKQYER